MADTIMNVQYVDAVRNSGVADAIGAVVETFQPAVEHNDRYIVQLTKDDSKVFGLAYRVLDSGSFVITGIIADSAVDMWNQICDPNYTICVGDEISQANSTTEPREMVEEMRTSFSVELHLQKTGPRWHVKEGKEGGVVGKAGKAGYTEGTSATVRLVSAEEEPWCSTAGRTSPLTPTQATLVVLSVLIPNVLLVALISDMGIGIKFYSAIVDDSQNLMQDRNMIGNGIISCASGLFVLLYILDWSKWSRKVLKIGFVIVIVYMFCIGAILKAKYYPQTPLVIILFHLPVFLGILRATMMKRTDRKQFYLAVASSTGFMAFFLIGLWLIWMVVESWDGLNMYSSETKARLMKDSQSMYDNWIVNVAEVDRGLVYDWDCSEEVKPRFELNMDLWLQEGKLEASDHKLTSEERNVIAKACGQVKTTWFLVWLAPFVGAMCQLIISIFCSVNGVWLNTEDTSKLEKVLKQFILMIMILMMMMWVSASIAGASMRLTGTLMAFCGSGIVALFVWIYMEIGSKGLTATMRQSKVMQSVLSLATSDWVRALLVIGLNMLIPSFLCINMMNQKMRRVRGLTDSRSWFTSGATKVITNLGQWKWSSILSKVNLLVMLYWTLSIGVAKITYVFLSWLNEALSQISMALVLTIFFFVGLTMFLLPPVPGIPVYITGGIVISARARSIDDIGGFWGGVAIAVVETFVLKLMAVCGQYAIGISLGKSVKIQQLCGVDKVVTRAMEKILQTPGMNLPKVSVLVGGPDWPTSVLCGILRLNLFQCLLGTTPVILVSSPCVLAGAFLSGPNEAGEGDENSAGVWDTLASTMLGLSGLGQLAAAGIALYYIQEFVHKYGEELSKPRPEHEPVVALTKAEAAYNAALDTVTSFGALSISQKVLMISSTMLMLMSLFVFMFLDEYCFRPFQVNNRINDDYADQGLNGDVLSIVKTPGWGGMALFIVACILHVVYVQMMNKAAKDYILHSEASGLAEDNHVDKIGTERRMSSSQSWSNQKLEAPP